jgi:hypothetical protein
MDLKLENEPDQSMGEKPPTEPRRAGPVTSYVRALAYDFRRFFSSITRETIISYLKTLAWAAPLTVLIWVYAESEEQVQDVNQTVNIEVTSNNPNKIAWLDPDENAIICDLEGPQANIDLFKQGLSPEKPITIDVDTSSNNSRQRIALLDALRENSRFVHAGVTVIKCAPDILTLNVDNLVSKRAVTVRPPPDLPGLQSITFDPPTVGVTGPQGLVNHLTQVTADFSSIKELSEPGTHTVDNVPLVADQSEQVTYDRTQVRVTVTVAETDVRGTISVPVWVTLAPNILGQYSISLNGRGFTPRFDVIGPPDQIAKLESGEITPQPHALLEISSENVNETNPVPVEIEKLPDGVRMAGAPPEASFTATKLAQ